MIFNNINFISKGSAEETPTMILKLMVMTIDLIEDLCIALLPRCVIQNI